MKRKRKKVRRTARNRKNTNPDVRANNSSEKPTSRRDALVSLRNWGLLALLGAGGAWYLASEVSATLAEHDLSRVGNGAPTIVQIHDPECPQCRALQNETRKALGALEDGSLQYLVANIRTPEGRSFASKHRVGHVTLVLLDGEGKRLSIISGVRNSASLERIFRAHARGSSQN